MEPSYDNKIRLSMLTCISGYFDNPKIKVKVKLGVVVNCRGIHIVWTYCTVLSLFFLHFDIARRLNEFFCQKVHKAHFNKELWFKTQISHTVAFKHLTNLRQKPHSIIIYQVNHTKIGNFLWKFLFYLSFAWGTVIMKSILLPHV